MGTIRVFSPAAEGKVSQSAPLPLPADLAGKAVGFLDNTKANFDRLASGMEALLRERHGVTRTACFRKANAATPAPPEILAALRDVDLVVTGSGD